MFKINKPFEIVVLESPILMPWEDESRTYAMLFRNSTNQVPPLDVIKPLV
jgi:hypothetical protein